MSSAFVGTTRDAVDDVGSDQTAESSFANVLHESAAAQLVLLTLYTHIAAGHLYYAKHTGHTSPIRPSICEFRDNLKSLEL